MPKFTTRLVERIEVAQGTMAFAFERPPDFHFTAGQFMTVILPDPPHVDAKGNRRVFSIASAPQEAGRLSIATRMTGSALKRSLADVPLGAPVHLMGPAGSFTLHADSSIPAVFIAGGIGITPFRSMIHDAGFRRLAHRMTLVYSNRNPEGTPFHDEFVKMAETYPSLTYVPTMTEARTLWQRWNGERRYVTGDFLRQHIGDLVTPLWYLAGPPGMVSGLTKVVIEAGADPIRVRSEEFEGY